MKVAMKCIRVSKFGGPDVLKLVNNLPIPKPIDKHVLIKVKAAGVNPVETYIRNGTHSVKPELPYTPGHDGSGIVDNVGENVTKVKIGDRIWFSKTQTGSYGEYSLCHEDWLSPLPSDISFEQGAMLGTPYLTAFRALVQKSGVKCGDTVLVHGATGGVGTAAIQICKILGANVICTAGSAGGEQLLKDMGVTKIYNHRSEGYIDLIKSEENKIDVILEMLSNINLQNDLNIISDNGRIVVIGCRGSIMVNPRLMMKSECSVIGCALGKSTLKEWEEQRRYIEEKLNAGLLKPILWKVYKLENADEAHKEIIENSGTKGQMVLKMDPLI